VKKKNETKRRKLVEHTKESGKNFIWLHFRRVFVFFHHDEINLRLNRPRKKKATAKAPVIVGESYGAKKLMMQAVPSSRSSTIPIRTREFT
jgi:hypothetical protein